MFDMGINGPISAFPNPMSRGRGTRMGEGGTCVTGPKGRGESQRRRPTNDMPCSLALSDARTPVPSDGSQTCVLAAAPPSAAP